MANIKTESIWSTLDEAGETQPGFERLRKAYDEQGRMLKEEEWGPEGQMLHQEEYRYDEQGRKIFEHKQFVLEGVEETHRWEYNEDGQIVKKESEYAGGFGTVKHYAYEQDRILVKVTDEEGTTEGREERTLDEAGRVIERKEYDEEDTLKAHITTEYDEQGRKTREEVRSWDDVFEEEWMYEYDEAGNLTVEKQLNEEGFIILRRLMEYEGDLMQRALSENLLQRLTIRREFDYNEAGQVVEEQRFQNDSPTAEAIASYRYEDGRLAEEIIRTSLFESKNEYRYTFYDQA